LPVAVKRINPILFGIGIYVGIQWSSLQFALKAFQSVNGLYENQITSGPKWRMTGFGFSLGYFFSK
jgi:hypothetical protein